MNSLSSNIVQLSKLLEFQQWVDNDEITGIIQELFSGKVIGSSFKWTFRVLLFTFELSFN